MKKIAAFSSYETAHFQKWIEEYAGKGYHPVNIGIFTVEFEQQEIPENRRYRVLNTGAMFMHGRERDLYEEAGWHFIENGIFHIAVIYTDDDSAEEPFTDRESMLRYYKKRMIIDLGSLLLVPLVLFLFLKASGGILSEYLKEPVTSVLYLGALLPAATILLSLLYVLFWIKLAKDSIGMYLGIVRGNSSAVDAGKRYASNCIYRITFLLSTILFVAAGIGAMTDRAKPYDYEDEVHPVTLEILDQSLWESIRPQYEKNEWTEEYCMTTDSRNCFLFDEIRSYDADWMYQSAEEGEYLVRKSYFVTYYDAKKEKTAKKLFEELKYDDEVTEGKLDDMIYFTVEEDTYYFLCMRYEDRVETLRYQGEMMPDQAHLMDALADNLRDE